MAVRKKRSISLPPDLDAEIAAAAEHAGMTYSSWLAATARKEFTIRAGLAAVAQFEDEHGAFTPGELADADQWAAEATERASRSGTSTRRRSAGGASPTTPAPWSPRTAASAASGPATAPCSTAAKSPSCPHQSWPRPGAAAAARPCYPGS